MSLSTFRIKDEVHTYKERFIVASGSAISIAEGIPTKAGSAGGVVPMVDGDGTTSQRFTGISASPSTDTVAAAGEVYVWQPFSDVIYEGSPKVTTDANTAAKIDALKYKRVVFDLTAAVWTVDASAGDSATNNLLITGGNFQDSGGLLHFVVKGSYLYA